MTANIVIVFIEQSRPSATSQGRDPSNNDMSFHQLSANSCTTSKTGRMKNFDFASLDTFNFGNLSQNVMPLSKSGQIIPIESAR